MAELTLTNDNFKAEVLESDKPVLVDFWAAWCGPCKMLAPIIDQLAEEHPEIKVGKVNVDEQSELASEYRIQSIPTVILFRDGQIDKSFTGYRSKLMIEEALGL